MKLIYTLLAMLFTGIIGYIAGIAKSFREQKLKTYENILPIFIRAAFNPSITKEEEFNCALIQLWLFASRRVALKMDHALACLVKPKRGDIKKALKIAITEMRKDIQILPWQKVKDKDVKHFYMRFKK